MDTARELFQIAIAAGGICFAIQDSLRAGRSQNAQAIGEVAADAFRAKKKKEGADATRFEPRLATIANARVDFFGYVQDLISGQLQMGKQIQNGYISIKTYTFKKRDSGHCRCNKSGQN